VPCKRWHGWAAQASRRWLTREQGRWGWRDWARVVRGPLRGPECYETPNAIADALGLGHTLRFWCRAQDPAAFKSKLDLRIKLVGVRSFLQLALSRSEVLEEAYFKQAIGVIQRLDRHKAYSAVKDLMSLLILYLHGGLYLDTTTRLSPQAERIRYGGQRDLGAATALLGGALRVVLLDGLQRHAPLLQTAQAILFGNDDDEKPCS